VKWSLSIRKKRVRKGERNTIPGSQMDFSTEAVITEMKRDGDRQTKATISD